MSDMALVDYPKICCPSWNYSGNPLSHSGVNSAVSGPRALDPRLGRAELADGKLPLNPNTIKQPPFIDWCRNYHLFNIIFSYDDMNMKNLSRSLEAFT